MTKITCLGYDLIMSAGAPPNTLTFRCYMQWAPCSEQTDKIITLGNLQTDTVTTLGTLPSGEGDSWKNLYGKTKIHKIVVKYMPAITQGMAGVVPGTTGLSPAPAALTFSNNAEMYTIPIYDNVDSVITDLGTIVPKPTDQDLNNMIQKPYTKAHSIYRPWTRIISPKEFMSYQSYQGGDLFQKRGGYFDLSNDVCRLNGLFIGMEPISIGGLTSGANVVESFPGDGAIFNLGKLQITVYQSFKVRT